MDETYSLEDVHAADFESRVMSAWEDDFRKILERREEFVDTACPACRSNEREPFLRCKGFEYWSCLRCRTAYVNPCPSESLILWFHQVSEALRIWREEMPRRVAQSRRKIYDHRRDTFWEVVARLATDVRSVLEVGAGGGEFARLMADDPRIDRVVAVEPQPLAVDHPRIEVVSGSFEQVTVKDPVDAVVAFEVLEHLVDPSAFFALARRSLRPGGVLLLTMPNGLGYEIQVLREHSSSVPFDHIRLYNPRSLELLLVGHGFEQVSIDTPGRLDVQMIQRQYEAGVLALAGRPELEVLLQPGREALRDELQERIVAQRLSSHMRCTAVRSGAEPGA